MKLSERLREYSKKSITIYHAQGLFESFAAEAAALERTQAENADLRKRIAKLEMDAISHVRPQEDRE